jgi:hypothetical protein
MRRRPEFRAECRTAAAEADARLREAESAFPQAIGVFLLSIVIYLWARGAHRRDAARARRRADPPE